MSLKRSNTTGLSGPEESSLLQQTTGLSGSSLQVEDGERHGQEQRR